MPAFVLFLFIGTVLTIGCSTSEVTQTAALDAAAFANPPGNFWPGIRFAIQGEFDGEDPAYLKGLEGELRDLHANGISNVEIQTNSGMGGISKSYQNELKVFYSVGNELGMAMDLRVGGAGGIKGGTPQALFSSDPLTVRGGYILRKGEKLEGTTELGSDNTFDEKLVAVIAVRYAAKGERDKVQTGVLQLKPGDFTYESVESESNAQDVSVAGSADGRGRGSMPGQGREGGPARGEGREGGSARGEGREGEPMPGEGFQPPGGAAPRGGGFSSAFSFGASPAKTYDVTITYVGDDIAIGETEDEAWDIIAYYKATDRDIGGMDNTDFYSQASAKVINENTDKLFDDELKALIKQNNGLFAVDGGDRNQRLSSDTWSDELAAKVKTLYGYDFIDYLAVQYTGYRLEDETAAERINNDWKEAYCYLFGDYLTALEKWAADNYDSGFRCQIGFSTMLDTGIVTQYVTQADVESFWPSGGSSIRDFNLECGYLPVVSVSNILGRSVTAGDELGAMYGAHSGSWTDFLLVHVNKAIYTGVNRMLYHVAESQYGNSWAYGYDGGMMNWGAVNPQYVAESEFNAYVARLQYILQNGRARRDFVVYDHTYDDDYRTSYIIDNSVEEAGYTFDIFSPGPMRTENGQTVKNGAIDPTGGGYQAFVLTHLLNCNTMPLDTAETILKYAENGVPIIAVSRGSIPTRTMSFGTLDRDGELADIFKKIDAMGKLTVIDSQDQLVETLNRLGIMPDTKKEESSRIVSNQQVSSDSGIRYYYLFNYATDDDNMAVSQPIHLKGTGTPYRMDLWGGKVSELANYVVTEDGYTTVDVSLAPNETCMIAILPESSNRVHAMDLSRNLSCAYDEDGALVLKATRDGAYDVTMSDGTNSTVDAKGVAAPVSLNAWNLTVSSWYSDDYTSTDIEHGARVLKKDLQANIDSLKPWSEIEGIGKGVSGVGTYSTTFTLDGGFDGATLNLGDVYDTVLVYLNGHQVFVNQTSLTADLGGYLVEGGNNLVVVAPSDLQNVILANGGENASRDAYQEYGLLGPVTVTPYVDLRLK